MRSRHLSRVIVAPPEKVYEFAANPDNLAAWASGLASGSVTRDGDTLLVESPMGRISVVFAERNDQGILDHDVTLPSGATVTNHLRVLSHPDGSEIVFTLRQLDLTDEEFERDSQAVEADLDQLKGILESTF